MFVKIQKHSYKNMPAFFQKIQTFIEGLNPFSLNLGIHLLFFFFCFFLFGIYIFVSKFFLNFIRKAISKKTPLWLRILVESLFFQKAIALSFWFVLYFLANNIPDISNFVAKAFFIPLLWLFLRTVDQFLICIHKLYERLELARNNPIKGYLQLVRIVLYILALIIFIVVIFEKNLSVLLGGVGALTAIILLIFRDTILSLVASIQIFSNKLIAPKDWVEIPFFKADGEVIDVNLHQVIIRNWDNSQSVIPIYKLMENSFKNWRNMYNEGRRILNQLWFDQKSIHICSKNLLKKLSKIPLLQEDIRLILERHTKGEPLFETNLTLFRKYTENYLKNHKMISDKFDTIIRNLSPTPEGLPMQIYAFCKETRWKKYESIQSLIIEHLISISKDFDLKIFQLENNHRKK